MDWPRHFARLETPEASAGLDRELQLELKPGHPLFGLTLRAIARRLDQDGAVFEWLDGSGRVADVHLTWAGDREQPPWPSFTMFESIEAWAGSWKC